MKLISKASETESVAPPPSEDKGTVFEVWKIYAMVTWLTTQKDLMAIAPCCGTSNLLLP
jgi:hypothetical protein